MTGPKLILILIILAGIGGGYYYLAIGGDMPSIPFLESTPKAQTSTDFSRLSYKFQFSATLPEGLKADYIPQIESISILDDKGESQIFIRYFRADQFLTLQTVNILQREETKVGTHAAVRYEIEKVSGIPDYPYQPDWRNGRHDLIDIRLAPQGTTYFYVIARNPKFPKAEFEEFIDSLVFEND